jgi:hypothetical protein
MELTDDGISAFALEEWLTRHFAVAQRRVSPYHTDVYRPYHTDVYRPYHIDVYRPTTQTCIAPTTQTCVALPHRRVSPDQS